MVNGKDIARWICDRHRNVENSLFFGSTEAVISPRQTSWESTGGIGRLASIVDEYKARWGHRMTLYTETMDSSILRCIISEIRSQPNPVWGIGIPVIEAPILGWGDLPRGIYCNGKDFFIVEGKHEQSMRLC